MRQDIAQYKLKRTKFFVTGFGEHALNISGKRDLHKKFT